jgi:hypothetical protein
MALARTLGRTSLRWRIQRAMTACACSLAVAGGAAWALRQPQFLIAVGVLTLLAAVWPVNRARIVRALDDVNRQQGRLVAAYEFAGAPSRTPFMEAAIRDAEARPLGEMPLPRRHWVGVLILLEVVVLLLPSAPADPRVRGARSKAKSAVEVASPARRRSEALAAVDALEAHLVAREAAQQAALRPISKDAHGAVTAQTLRSLADAIAGRKLTQAARAELQQALERARESERTRLAEAQRDATQREQERKLEQLTRPQTDERRLEQLKRPQPEERSGPGESSQPQQPNLEQQLGRAAETLPQAGDGEAERALRDAAESLAAQQRQTQQQRQQLEQLREQLQRPAGDPQRREQFEQAARGGGSERDPGEHAPAERRIGGSYQDERLRGAHGEGPSRSQVIEGASQTGFASAPYRRVYADYRAHAEQLLERDDVPAGERFYVRRYFDLVQPRDAR